MFFIFHYKVEYLFIYYITAQGLGLYAARDIEKYTMVIEYIGTIIRNEVANRKEKMYETQVRLNFSSFSSLKGFLFYCFIHLNSFFSPHFRTVEFTCSASTVNM